jgi:transcription initiation factor IIF auxiliary subunit
MALSIQQSQEYMGSDRWRWSVWLEGTSEELNAIDHVTYILHPSFHRPVRRVTDRATNFRLETSGWGAFTLYATIATQSGEETTLHHDLQLLYPNGTATVA